MGARALSRSEDERGETKKRQYGLVDAATQESIPKQHRQETSPRESESVREVRHMKDRKQGSGSRTSSPHKSKSHRRSRSRSLEHQHSRHRKSEPHREDRKR